MSPSKNARKRQRQRRLQHQRAQAGARRPDVEDEFAPQSGVEPDDAVPSIGLVEAPPALPQRPRPEPEPRRPALAAVPPLEPELEPEPEPVADPEPEPEPEFEPDTDTDPDPAEPAAPAAPLWADEPRDRRPLLMAVGGIVAALAVVGGMVAWSVTRGTDDTSAVGQLSSEQASLYAPPVAVRPGTSYVETRVLPSGALRVTHWIHSRKPIETVAVHEPTSEGLPVVTVSGLVVRGDDVSAFDHDADTHVYQLYSAHHLYVSYELKGAVSRDPSPAGRALAPITALEVTDDQPVTSVVHRILGRGVLNLACSAAVPDAVPHPCGTPVHHGWQVELGQQEAHQRVQAQLDLR